MPCGIKIDQRQVERCARMYRSNKDAAAALGVSAPNFGRLCRRYGLETPSARHTRRLREAAIRHPVA